MVNRFYNKLFAIGVAYEDWNKDEDYQAECFKVIQDALNKINKINNDYLLGEEIYDD